MQKDRVKIAFFLPYLEVGGIEKLYVSYVNHLVAYFDVSLITCCADGAYREMISNRVNILELKGTRIRTSLLKLIHVLKVEKFDVVVGSNILANIVMLIASFFVRGTKYIATQHSYINNESKHMGFYARFFLFYMKILYPKADKVIAVSKGIQEFLLQDVHLQKQKVHVVYNSIDIQDTLDKSTLKMDTKLENYIMYLGRMTNVKNIPFLLKAFDKVADDSLKLCLVGDGPCENELRRIAGTCKKGNKIFFLGAKSNPMPYLKNAKCLVLPSFSESFGIVLLEAICLNTPIVSTPTEGALEVVSRCSGAFIINSFDNITELARNIEKAVKHKGDKFDTYARRFSTEKSVKELKQLIDSLRK